MVTDAMTGLPPESFIPVTFSHWLIFNGVIAGIIAFDMWRFHKNPAPQTIKKSLILTLGWVMLALLFNVWIFLQFGSQPAVNFLTGYLLEESLSIDNLFIFLIIFSHFKVPEASKHKVLFYGVISAIMMRGLLIALGVVFVEKFAWSFYILGAFLIYTGIHLILKKNESFKIENSSIYTFFQRFIAVTPEFHGNDFLVRKNNQWIATPLLFVLILIETADLVFAMDSVPAILGITTDPFIVYTSNIFAILGLRSLFFVLEHFMVKFAFVHDAVACILVFIGLKMLVKNYFHVSAFVTLSVVLLLLLGGIGLSLVKKLKKAE